MNQPAKESVGGQPTISYWKGRDARPVRFIRLTIVKLRKDIGTSVDEYLDSARRKAEELKTSATNLAQRGLRGGLEGTEETRGLGDLKVEE